MILNLFSKSMVLVLAIFISTNGVCQVNSTGPSEQLKKQPPKELLIPAKVYRIPENNNYNNDTTAYSFKRMVQGENIAINLHKEF